MAHRIANESLRRKITTAEDAAELIKDGDNVGFAGFTGAGYPKALPVALAEKMRRTHAEGNEFRIGAWTGASTAPELDGSLAEANGISLRTPYQSDPATRARINAGDMDYVDIHLSHVAPLVWEGFLGNLDVAVIEVAGITEDGHLIPSSSVGNNKTYLDRADRIILEVNSWQSADLEGMHDIYYGTALPPNRVPIPLVAPGDRIGEKYYRVDPDRIVAVIETDQADRNTPFKPLDDTSRAIANHLLDFLDYEVEQGRVPKELLPLQSGVGNIANAVLAGLLDRPYRDLTSYTEVIQDGMLDLIDSGKIAVASATAFSLSPDAAEKMNRDASHYRKHIILRPQEISNHPELIRRLGVISMNGLIEADIYGNVNSTHIMGSKMQNGIGGSGDFSRNAYISTFVTPSTAKGGAISAIVPFVSHVDHTEHDVDVIVTEQGLADLRGLAPRKRAERIINNCAHPDFRPMLRDYYEQARKVANGQHTPHDLEIAHSWHQRFLRTGSMKPEA
ncbi:acetyl-CoA hydrolase/transferase family protein [Dermatophilus congolensis]|uniref:Propionyl-CoA:succinate CoA transferase n=1 Tax=Dermatophilus congolensis TaxID=1863 RepID=A0AA46H0F7_9MICO|nr:acetyl-CoA hydrolase/transferase family protein [Dermatophilus congolensis]MBO3142925.1 acetyl-CoA hydrolase/transferase family protein [Dermatophilus congolensis]MBO3151916.1 acetyl-CoA hydrolase/transferase family protein [Dermatophilus congolensis]MBO3161078.1 acetyl-CoA hydrolase/transferase family protein [Dermatophilus congolensis]MBO3163198.1 acetyl-CoA hydrolase/transferase family protein [Dermatophilus congolensis]MBO3176755.1 acetyl-CoA hydrolase/transferase family protein [Dermat